MPLSFNNLPPLSPLTHELLALSIDADDAERRLCRICASEPQLSVRLLAVANSAAYRRGSAALVDVTAAIRRIGLARTRQLAIALLFGHPVCRSLPPALTEDIWLHALAMAAAAQEIARLKGHPDPALAYLAGLVHDLGYLVEELLAAGSIVRAMHCALTDNLSPDQAEERQLGVHHARVAADLLAHWKAPAAIVEAMADHHRDDADPDSLAAVLFGAEKLARFADVADVLYAGREHPFATISIDRLGVEFLFAEQLELTPDEVTRLAERIVEQVDDFQSAALALGARH